jgi:hypothetical protein
MKEIRRLSVSGRRFSRTDLYDLGRIFQAQCEQTPRDYPRPRLSMTLHCKGGITYESDDLHHLEEGAEIDLRHVNAISFEFYDSSRDHQISLQLTEGSGSSDELRVGGADRAWVQTTFTTLLERLNAVAPSSSWFSNHPHLTFHLCAFGIGAGVQLIIDLVLRFMAQASPEIAKLLSLQIRLEGVWAVLAWVSVHPPGSWLLMWVSGAVWGAGPLSRWILSAWPRIELDVGPPHERMPAARRSRIRFAVTVLLVPVVLRFAYDIFSSLAREPR